MTYGVEVFNPSGTKVFSSVAHKGAVFVELVEVAYASTTVTRSYPEWAGRTGLALDLNGCSAASLSLTWSYAPGYPELTITRNTAVSGGSSGVLPIYVFIR